ncbi:IS21-like element helper ATPase IstB [Olsenella sp. Marseille-P4559]|uniref:IS21-like element helper ATPase IstB n=1 Tax=Olsenella sp. Marseille-P4559 TaxID=2364795 RepID=UPI0013EF0A61|nr:IS21-like element helper ATPase IstB [Olsenella sp. Marseille-P4559]
MTVPPDGQEDARRMDRDGVPRSRIARELGVSRNTVAKYADKPDMSPEPPLARRRARPATDGLSHWTDAILEAGPPVPGKQRHTSKRVYERAVDEMGYEGSYSSVRRYVAAWRGDHARGPRDGHLELEWVPGTAQVDFGNFRATVAGRAVGLKPLVATLPHSNARYCVALPRERAEVFCRGLRAVFERIGRAPRLLVPGNATEAGRMLSGRVTESEPFSQFRAHYRCESRHRDPYSGNERGSVGNAVGFLRRNLLVPVPEADSLDEPGERLASGCDRINAGARNREGRETAKALPEDLAGMLALPGTPFDAAGWAHARADKRGYVRVDGNLYCAGPAWHDRELLVGVRARTVEVLADRGRHVATLARSFGEGETAGNPVSLIPALVARPRAFGESTIRRDMPDGLVEAIDRCGKADRRQALRVLGRVAGVAGFGAACEAEERVFAGGRVPDEASCDMLARRIAAGRRRSLTKSVLAEWARRGTPRQVEHLAGYLEAECASREASKRANLPGRCALPQAKTFDGYEWGQAERPDGFGRDDLLSLSFLDDREDLVLMGDVGTGKTHMAEALCALACQRARPARFFTASSLVMRLRRARDDGRLDRELAQLGGAELLVIDELGFLPLDADGARLLFQVVSEAYEAQSVVFTTNLEFSRWGSVFGDDQMAAAVIDRVVHHGRLLQFRGESYRVRHALMQ